MKVIIAGSRGITEYDQVCQAVKESGFNITQVVSGTARGVDRLGEKYAADNNIDVKRFPADWDGIGRSAGYVRNAEMADYADALIALYDGESKGTQHMINLAEKKGIKIYILRGE